MNEGKHAVEETMAGCKRHLHDDPKKSLKCIDRYSFCLINSDTLDNVDFPTAGAVRFRTYLLIYLSINLQDRGQDINTQDQHQIEKNMF